MLAKLYPVNVKEHSNISNRASIQGKKIKSTSNTTRTSTHEFYKCNFRAGKKKKSNTEIFTIEQPSNFFPIECCSCRNK